MKHIYFINNLDYILTINYFHPIHFIPSNVSQIQNKHSSGNTTSSSLSKNDKNENSDSLAIQTNNIQLLLCGDLNSLPDSGVVQYLLDGKISTDHKDFKNLPYKNALTKMLSHSANEKSYTHAFKVIYFLL